MSLLTRTWRTARGLPVGHLGVVVSVAAALALMGLFVQVTGQARRVVDGWGAAARLVCELDPARSASQQAATAAALAALPSVAGATRISPADALARFRSRSPAARALVEGVDDDLLPPSVELAVAGGGAGWQDGERLAAQAAATPGVTAVSGGPAAFSRLGRAARLLHVAALGLGSGVAVLVAAICANTIRLALARQHDEIEVMRLVGATWGFVAAPYVVMAAAWGVLAGLLAAATLALGERALVMRLGPALAAAAGGAPWRLFAPQVAMGLVAAGAAACALASLGVLWGSRELDAR